MDFAAYLGSVVIRAAKKKKRKSDPPNVVNKYREIVVILFKYFNEFGRIDQAYILNATS